MNETRFRSRVPFESSRIPDLDESILSSGDEEGVVWGDKDSKDGPNVLGELADEDRVGGIRIGGGGGGSRDGSSSSGC